MRNESLIEWVFYNEKSIRQAVSDGRNDDCRVKSCGHGSGISNPTQAQALRNAMPLKCVAVPFGKKGGAFRLSNPENWLKVCDKVKIKFGGTVQGELFELYYQHNLPNKDVIEKLRLSRSMFYLLKSEIITFAEGVAIGLGLYLE